MHIMEWDAKGVEVTVRGNAEKAILQLSYASGEGVDLVFASVDDMRDFVAQLRQKMPDEELPF